MVIQTTWKYFTKNQENFRIKKLIIFSGISIPAIQSLVFIHVYGVNVPFWDEWDLIWSLKPFFAGDDNWIQIIFQPHNTHRIFFPKLIFIADAVLTSFNVKILMYLNWTLASITLIPLYHFLKKTDSKFIWLIIPIAIILYSPIQWEGFLWGMTLVWFLTLSLVTWSIFFLNKEGKLNFSLAIGLAIVASFSLSAGLTIWPIGIIGILLLKNRIRRLLVWVPTTIFIIFIYFLDFTGPPRRKIILSTENFHEYLAFVLTYLGSGFQTPDIYFKTIIGLVLFITFVAGIFVFYYKKKDRSPIVPWIQLGLVGFFASLLTGLGYQNAGIIHSTASRYITISNLFVIASIVFLIIILTILWNSKKRNTKVIVATIFCFFIISGSILMTSNYVLGWESGKLEHKNRTLALECFSLPMKIEHCYDLWPVWQKNRFPTLANGYLELNLTPFSYLDYESLRGQDHFFDEDIWNSLPTDNNVIGAIGIVTKTSLIPNPLKYGEPIISISGWILDKDKKTVDKMYLLIDNRPFLVLEKINRFPGIDSDSQDEHFKAALKHFWWDRDKNHVQSQFPEVSNNDFTNFIKWFKSNPKLATSYQFENFKPRPDVVEYYGLDTDLNSGWRIEFFTNYLEKGCHEVSIGVVSNNTKAIIPSKSQICV